jgi:hypothetical protein
MPLHIIVLEAWQLLHIPIEGNGQLAAGIDATEENFRNSLTASLSAIPNL